MDTCRRRQCHRRDIKGKRKLCVPYNGIYMNKLFISEFTICRHKGNMQLLISLIPKFALKLLFLITTKYHLPTNEFCKIRQIFYVKN